MRGLALALLLGAPACLFPSPDANHRYACATSADCGSGRCAAGRCVYVDAGPTGCGTVGSCPSGTVCDNQVCAPLCAAGARCGDGGSCDLALDACVTTESCNILASGLACGPGSCQFNVCVPTPSNQDTSPDAGCGGSVDGGSDGGSVSVGGVVELLDNARLTAGTVTFFPNGSVDGGVIATIDANGAYKTPSALPLGLFDVRIDGSPGGSSGVIPTYFPGVIVQSPSSASSAKGSATLDFKAVASEGIVAGLARSVGETPIPGHLVWLGTAAVDCTRLANLAGYTVGLSPPAGLLGYLSDSNQANLTIDATLMSAGPSGQFMAFDAPYATTAYVRAILDASNTPRSFQHGMFTPPPFAGGTIAVALIYPFTSQ